MPAIGISDGQIASDSTSASPPWLRINPATSGGGSGEGTEAASRARGNPQGTCAAGKLPSRSRSRSPATPSSRRNWTDTPRWDQSPSSAATTRGAQANSAVNPTSRSASGRGEGVSGITMMN